ncbi:MAG: hypothetical protein ABW061_06255 [Polyangiaceae bacterium]
MNTVVTLLIGVIAAFLALLQVILLWRIWTNKIDLSQIISGGNGQASLARFQFLIFTFVIAIGILYLTIKGQAFPQLDEGILVLLGISSASYVVGKSLDTQNPSVGKGNDGTAAKGSS